MKFKQLPWCPLTPLAPDLKKSGFSGDDSKHPKLITKLQNIKYSLRPQQQTFNVFLYFFLVCWFCKIPSIYRST